MNPCCVQCLLLSIFDPHTRTQMCSQRGVYTSTCVLAVSSITVTLEVAIVFTFSSWENFPGVSRRTCCTTWHKQTFISLPYFPIIRATLLSPLPWIINFYKEKRLSLRKLSQLHLLSSTLDRTKNFIHSFCIKGRFLLHTIFLWMYHHIWNHITVAAVAAICSYYI